VSAVIAIIVAGLAVAAAIALLGLLAVVIAGIHAAERRQSLPHAPRSRSEAIARRVLGVHTAQARPARHPHADSRR
jgi:hypothetical protein